MEDLLADHQWMARVESGDTMGAERLLLDHEGIGIGSARVAVMLYDIGFRRGLKYASDLRGIYEMKT
jgi:hypothetical protein